MVFGPGGSLILFAHFTPEILEPTAGAGGGGRSSHLTDCCHFSWLKARVASVQSLDTEKIV